MSAAILFMVESLLCFAGVGVQVFPLPVEGAETKVLADDQEVANYMIDLGDLLETVRGSFLARFALKQTRCIKTPPCGLFLCPFAMAETVRVLLARTR